jgi:hypothetical protein
MAKYDKDGHLMRGVCDCGRSIPAGYSACRSCTFGWDSLEGRIARLWSDHPGDAKGNLASEAAMVEAERKKQTKTATISDDELGRIARDAWLDVWQQPQPDFDEPWSAVAKAVRLALEASTEARATRAQHVYQACLDWEHDIGACHFCNYPGPKGEHEEDCPMVEALK